MELKISENSYNDRANVRNHKILASASAFGILRQQLVKYIGINRIKGFLFHFGWQMGVTDANEAMRKNSSLEDLIKQGPIFHITNGHISGMEHDCKVTLDERQNIVSILGQGIWIDSYEAAQHMKWHGISEFPVCHTLTGYASGYMSTVSGQKLLAKEMTCVGKGDSECRWVVKKQSEWESGKEELYSYNELPIVKELEYTYEQLIEQQNFVTRLSRFQNKLTEEVSNGSSLQEIANFVYEMVKIPILIEDIDHRMIAYSGLSNEQYQQLSTDLASYMLENSQMIFFRGNGKQKLPFRKKIINTTTQNRLITPILVQKELMGYCHFIYQAVKENEHSDILFLDRVANAASLILLNEKTSFKSFERMKGNFLEQVLDEKFPEIEMIKRGKYTGLDLGYPFYISVMEYRKTESTIEEEFLLQEQIFETTFHYFNEKKHNILVGQRNGHMILLIPSPDMQKMTITQLLSEFHHFLLQKYPDGQFKFGISNLGENITKAKKSYEEAMMALRLTMGKRIVSFKSLGIVGVLINSKNISGIKMIAEQELGPLNDTRDLKTVELLKTLYFFLMNGGKLEQTMSDLALSMSGLRHRIKKIEGLLEKDLRDPNEMHQLILIIKALMAIGELNMDVN